MELTLIVSSLVAMIILGAPISIAMTTVPVVYILITGEIPLSAIPYQMFKAVAIQPLLAIPFFILTAEVMNAGTITIRLLDLARELVGRFRGGLGQVNVVGSMMFSSMNGSAVADVAAIGGALIPAMKKEGYGGPFSAALTAAGSTIGAIFPPSILLVILASTMGFSIGAVFAAGVIPGILIGLILMVIVYFYALRNNMPRYEKPFTFLALFKAIYGALGALLIPFVIVGGIISGVFTATEAGAIAAFTGILIGKFIYKTLTLKSLGAAVYRAVKVSAPIFMIIAASGPLSWLLNRIGALSGLEGFLVQFVSSPILFSLIIVLFILAVGTLIEPVSAVVMLGPTLIAACTHAGFTEMQAAMVVAVGFITGSITPPVGLSYFTAAVVGKERVEAVALAVIPFALAEVGVIFMILLFPAVTMILPQFLGLL